MRSKTHRKDLVSNPKPIEINGRVIYRVEAYYSAIRELFGLHRATEHVHLLLQNKATLGRNISSRHMSRCMQQYSYGRWESTYRRW